MMGSPLLSLWHDPPNPDQNAFPASGPNTVFPVLSKTWYSGLMYWTYCVVPGAPSLSGGMLVQNKGSPNPAPSNSRLKVGRILFRLQHRIVLNLVAPVVVRIGVVLDLMLGRQAVFGKQRRDLAKQRSGVVFKFLDDDWSLSHRFGLLSERRQCQTDNRQEHRDCNAFGRHFFLLHFFSPTISVGS